MEEIEDKDKEVMILDSIKVIHNKKRKADINNITVMTKELEPNIVEETLESLCMKNVLHKIVRSGSYLFVKNSETNSSVVENCKNCSVVENWVEENSKLGSETNVLEEKYKFEFLTDVLTQINTLKETVSYKLDQFLENDILNKSTERRK